MPPSRCLTWRVGPTWGSSSPTSSSPTSSSRVSGMATDLAWDERFLGRQHSICFKSDSSTFFTLFPFWHTGCNPPRGLA
jgi:hypothetical protein